MIRYACQDDHAAIAEVNTAAFGRPDEAELVARLRVGDALVELVFETAGVIDGHILFSRLRADRPALYVALAPMAVRPVAQRTGVGSALVRAGLEACKHIGVHGVIVVGHPAYYPRFGFATETAAKVSSVYAGSPAFMALALEPGAFDAPSSVVYPDAFAR